MCNYLPPICKSITWTKVALGQKGESYHLKICTRSFWATGRHAMNLKWSNVGNTGGYTWNSLNNTNDLDKKRRKIRNLTRIWKSKMCLFVSDSLNKGRRDFVPIGVFHLQSEVMPTFYSTENFSCLRPFLRLMQCNVDRAQLSAQIFIRQLFYDTHHFTILPN